jgi:hypothetical protein
MPIDMRMLTYYHEKLEENNNQIETLQNDKSLITNRSNFSSAESVNSRLNRNSGSGSNDSADTVGHHNKNDHVFKPFKNEKSNNNSSSFMTNVNDYQEEFTYQNKTDDLANYNAQQNKDYNSFFMTQVDFFKINFTLFPIFSNKFD